MKHFDNITLAIIDTAYYGGAIGALKKSMQQASFASVKFFTDRAFAVGGVEIVKIAPITSKKDYSRFVIYELYKHFDTDFVWIIQHDGFILDISQWNDEFLEYDGVGASWTYIDGRNNFNGGFSIRSKKLQTILGTDPMIQVYDPEDAVIGRLYRRYLEETHGIKFPPDEVCDRFAFELNEPKQPTVGFHGNFWQPYRKTIVIIRRAALGDVVQCEPILHYYFTKGYRVVLDTLPQFYSFFQNHYFPVEFYEHFNKKVKHEIINLDFSYESDPQKLHLQAYYEFCNIPKEEWVIRNPQLNFVVDDKIKLFKKYVLIHIDKRADGHRNIEGVDWRKVVSHLKEKSYDVFQIGKGEHEETGAIEMKTVAENLMAYLICGCDLFIGIDSGCSNVALATNRKMVVAHGSVDPSYIYPDQTNIRIVTNHNKEKPVCETPYCWHSVIGCEGKKCIVNENNPPCAIYKADDFIKAIDELI